ncbi:MAG: NAD(P)/FAD-dependent oxidoreductase [Bacteroidota bacterium]
MMDIYDIIIIGGGPAGLFASYSAGMHSIETEIIDILPELGGQLTSLYPEKYIYDIPGFPKILAKEYAGYLINQATQNDPAISLGKRITRMEKTQTDKGKLFKLAADDGEIHHGRTILLTSGLSETLPKKLDLPDIARFENKGILYFVKNLKELAGKQLLIVGGGDSALDWALNLNGIAAEITIIHRRNAFRGQEKSVEKLQATPTIMKLSHELREIQGDRQIESAVIFNNETQREEILSIDNILFCLGFYTLPGPLKDWGLKMDKNDITVNQKMETNITGIYAAGDIAYYAGKVKMIVTGLGEATVAVNSIREYLRKH